jgi:hypothetical protein
VIHPVCSLLSLIFDHTSPLFDDCELLSCSRPFSPPCKHSIDSCFACSTPSSDVHSLSATRDVALVSLCFPRLHVIVFFLFCRSHLATSLGGRVTTSAIALARASSCLVLWVRTDCKCDERGSGVGEKARLHWTSGH